MKLLRGFLLVALAAGVPVVVVAQWTPPASCDPSLCLPYLRGGPALAEPHPLQCRACYEAVLALAADPGNTSLSLAQGWATEALAAPAPEPVPVPVAVDPFGAPELPPEVPGWSAVQDQHNARCRQLHADHPDLSLASCRKVYWQCLADGALQTPSLQPLAESLPLQRLPDAFAGLPGPADVELLSGIGHRCANGLREAAESCLADAGPGRSYETLDDCLFGSRGIAHRVASAALAPVAGMLRLAGGGLLSIFESEGSCFNCSILWIVAASVFAVGRAGFELLAEPMLIFLALIFATWIAIQASRVAMGAATEEGLGGWAPLMGGSIRYLVALMFLGAFAGADAAVSVYDELMARFIGPLLSSSVAAGRLLLDTMAPAGGGGSSGLLQHASDDAEALVATLQASTPVDESLAALGSGLVHLAMAAHLVGKVGLAKAIAFFQGPERFTSTLSELVALGLGLMLGLMFTMFLLRTGLRLVDPVLRVVIALAFLPVLVAAWVFRSTRQIALVGIRAFAYAAVFFLVSGVLYGLALELALQGVAPEPGMTYDQILTALSGRGPNPYSTHGILQSGQVDVKSALVAFVTLLMAEAVMKLVSEVAAQLSDFRPQGGVGEEAERKVGGIVSQAGGFAMQGAMMGAMMGGRVAGSLFGAGRRMFPRS